ncbi:MAG: hypothetical protein NUV56_05010 [Candidatus Uhrbacteria bacterium]|nr:hypothetical protein [Candidatus Uhrbacteria bacterium]
MECSTLLKTATLRDEAEWTLARHPDEPSVSNTSASTSEALNITAQRNAERWHAMRL